MKLKYIPPKIGERDRIIINENDERIAFLLKKANNKGYEVSILFGKFETFDCGTIYQAIYLVKNKLKERGIIAEVA
jgi:hypothetical protein